MPYETDQRLRSYLDSDQLSRERLCLSVLAADRRFSDVRPRHPHGGRDGGVDIDATTNNGQRAAGAIGFVVGANDSRDQKTVLKKKFLSDVLSARSGENPPEVFVFFTNVNLTISEKDKLRKEAVERGFASCEIFDRERLRIALDSVDGFATRIQYLGIPLTDSEQASFFARWGDDIQSVISTGFQRIERTLNRVLFLQEASDALTYLVIRCDLNRSYAAEEIGHFRAFCFLTLLQPKIGIMGMLFGSSDKSQRFYKEDRPISAEKAGIRHGISGGQWEWRYEDQDGKPLTVADQAPNAENGDGVVKWVHAGSSSSIGASSADSIIIKLSHASDFIRYDQHLSLIDFDGAHFIHLLSASLAGKLQRIRIFANGYQLASHGPDEWRIDPTPFESNFPLSFTDDELSDPWVRLRGKIGSMHTLDFKDITPLRLFISRELAEDP